MNMLEDSWSSAVHFNSRCHVMLVDWAQLTAPGSKKAGEVPFMYPEEAEIIFSPLKDQPQTVIMHMQRIPPLWCRWLTETRCSSLKSNREEMKSVYTEIWNIFMSESRCRKKSTRKSFRCPECLTRKTCTLVGYWYFDIYAADPKWSTSLTSSQCRVAACYWIRNEKQTSPTTQTRKCLDWGWNMSGPGKWTKLQSLKLYLLCKFPQTDHNRNMRTSGVWWAGIRADVSFWHQHQ